MIMYQSNTTFRWQLQSNVSGYGCFLLQTNLVQSFYCMAEIDSVSKKKSFYLNWVLICFKMELLILTVWDWMMQLSNIALQKKMKFLLLENTFIMYNIVKEKAVWKYILNGD